MQIQVFCDRNPKWMKTFLNGYVGCLQALVFVNKQLGTFLCRSSWMYALSFPSDKYPEVESLRLKVIAFQKQKSLILVKQREFTFLLTFPDLFSKKYLSLPKLWALAYSFSSLCFVISDFMFESVMSFKWFSCMVWGKQLEFFHPYHLPAILPSLLEDSYSPIGMFWQLCWKIVECVCTCVFISGISVPLNDMLTSILFCTNYWSVT